MRYLLFAIGFLAAPLGAFALTWDFDEGTTWGWTAQESYYSSGTTANATTVNREVEDGVWRIAPVPDSQESAVQLLSPPIGEDSALFDYVTLRLRIIHHTPTNGALKMQWFNAEFRRLDVSRQLGLWSRFNTGRYQIYPTQWQDITIDIRALEAAITWQDTLFDFQLDLNLNIYAEGPTDHPAFVEVDWIQLTGVEELLLGELQPQATVVEAGWPGVLFAEPDFFPLGEGIGQKNYLQASLGTLGDVDGDGDVDLVAVWERPKPDSRSQFGWTIASNDGLGGFVPTQEATRQATGIDLEGSDFDGDGLLDLVFTGDQIIEVWHNRGEDGFETTLRLSGVLFRGLADGDGDGDLDLLGKEPDDESSPRDFVVQRWRRRVCPQRSVRSRQRRGGLGVPARWGSLRARRCVCYGFDRATYPKGLGN